MNCAQFQEILPEVIDGGRNAEQEAHLQSCAVCSGLVADLDMIAGESRHLQELAEPAPRVWNSIEIALRSEGLIRETRSGPALLPPVKRSWSLGWLVPVAAAMLIGSAILIYQRGARESQPVAKAHAVTPVVVSSPSVTSRKVVNNNSEDQQLLEAVGSRTPTMQAAYASNLQNVNEYIRDAEESAQADPNNEEAQQVVMDAYEQRSTVYQMALDRSLP